MGARAQSAAPDTTAWNISSKLWRGMTCTSRPRMRRAASSLKAPRSPWKAALMSRPVVTAGLYRAEVDSRQSTVDSPESTARDVHGPEITSGAFFWSVDFGDRRLRSCRLSTVDCRLPPLLLPRRPHLVAHVAHGLDHVTTGAKLG